MFDRELRTFSSSHIDFRFFKLEYFTNLLTQQNCLEKRSQLWVIKSEVALRYEISAKHIAQNQKRACPKKNPAKLITFTFVSQFGANFAFKFLKV